MKRIPVWILIVFCFAQCKKENDNPNIDHTFFVSFKLDGELKSITLPPNSIDTSTGTNFTLEAHTSRFSSGSRFTQANWRFQCVVGNFFWHQTNDSVLFNNRRILSQPGPKQFDYLQGRDMHDVVNKVEIEYVDPEGTVWCTTKQKTSADGYYFEPIHVNQPNSTFQITDVSSFSVSGLQPYTYFVTRANFNCILYERDGEREHVLTEGVLVSTH